MDLSSKTRAASRNASSPASPQNKPARNAAHRLAPGPSTFHSLQNGLQFLRDPFRVLNGVHQQYGSIVRFKLGGQKVLHLIHLPEHTQHVLLHNNRNYHKCSPYALLKVLFGRGLLFNEGESWLVQRRLLQPAFQPKHFSTLAEGVGDTIAAGVKEWKHTRDAQKTDVEAEMSALSRRIVGYILFGKNVPTEVSSILQSDESKLSFLLGNMAMTPQNFRAKAAIQNLDKAVYRVIAERRANLDENSVDMLSALLRAKDKDTGEGMSDRQLRDEMVTLLFSGFDTTARTLSWVFHVLGEHPEVEARLHEELERVLGGRMPEYSDMEKLTYTAMVVKETMRVFPANPIIGRQAKSDDTLGGYHIPAGSVITLSPYLAHRDPTLWNKPEVFDPERFSPERESELPRFAYFPFGGGPRQCIGKGLAMMTIPMAIATIAQQYRYRPVPNFTVEHDLKVTFQSRRGVMATRHLRPALNA
jgi:cytochrome P450